MNRLNLPPRHRRARPRDCRPTSYRPQELPRRVVGLFRGFFVPDNRLFDLVICLDQRSGIGRLIERLRRNERDGLAGVKDLVVL